MRSGLMRWADKHLVIPRWIITMLYVQFTVLGIALSIGGSPVVNEATSGNTPLWWSAAITIGAAIATVGSRRVRLETLELIGSVILCGCLLLYTYAVWSDLFADGFTFIRMGGAIAITIVTDIPLLQLAYLLSRVGKPKSVPPTSPPPVGI